MGDIIDLREARAIRTAKAELERRMAELETPIDWQTVADMGGPKLTGPGGIDDLVF